jgi:hypothetical protein
MKASELVAMYGKKLVGRNVVTQAIGEWPGGPAKVVRVGHDKNAPEIVFMVVSLNPAVRRKYKEMGVFDYEECTLMCAPAVRCLSKKTQFDNARITCGRCTRSTKK